MAILAEKWRKKDILLTYYIRVRVVVAYGTPESEFPSFEAPKFPELQVPKFPELQVPGTSSSQIPGTSSPRNFK